jgi:exopolyphosphatase/guanosine-5'-triphosphate,3'-diphosphate pyrophosphatase
MTERHMPGDPPGASEVAAARADVTSNVERALTRVHARPEDGPQPTLVGLAGSVTTVAALALGLDHYDPARIHQARIDRAAVERVTTELLVASRAQRLAMPVMHPGRADVIAAGALILQVVMEQAGADAVIASEHDILDGIAFSAASLR